MQNHSEDTILQLQLKNYMGISLELKVINFIITLSAGKSSNENSYLLHKGLPTANNPYNYKVNQSLKLEKKNKT